MAYQIYSAFCLLRKSFTSILNFQAPYLEFLYSAQVRKIAFISWAPSVIFDNKCGKSDEFVSFIYLV